MLLCYRRIRWLLWHIDEAFFDIFKEAFLDAVVDLGALDDSVVQTFVQDLVLCFTMFLPQPLVHRRRYCAQYQRLLIQLATR